LRALRIHANRFEINAPAKHRRRYAFLLTLVIAAGGVALAQTDQNPPPPIEQQLPDAPSASKKAQTAIPRQQQQEREKGIVGMTTGTARTTLFKARDWESSRIAGIYVGRNRKLVPLTRDQRVDYYLHQTLTTPEAYMKRMFAAGIDQARGAPYQWNGGWAGYGERFASREGQFITANSLAALGNAKLGYEVRYDKCKCDDFKHRMRHAILRNFLTYDRTEANRRPQLGLYGGAFGGGLLSTAWKPSPKNVWANGGWAVLGQAAYGSVLNLVSEFSTEINRKQGVKSLQPSNTP